MSKTLSQIANGFGVVTVMNVKLLELKNDKTYSEVLSYDDFQVMKDNDNNPIFLDTLKIANFADEGPTKTINGGQYVNPLIKYGKKTRLEMQDALGRLSVLKAFFGAEVDGENGKQILSITDKFPGAFGMIGDSFYIDRVSGEKVPVEIFVPQFSTDAILNMAQDSEGEAAVFDLNGDALYTDIQVNEDTVRTVPYQIGDAGAFGTFDDPVSA